MQKKALKFPSDEYRIVTDPYLGFTIQIKNWWFPIWHQTWLENPGTFSSMAEALEWVNGPKGRHFKSIELVRGKL